MAGKNRVKPDIILKEFWRDNERFADLFNGALFGGQRYWSRICCWKQIRMFHPS